MKRTAIASASPESCMDQIRHRAEMAFSHAANLWLLGDALLQADESDQQTEGSTSDSLVPASLRAKAERLLLCRQVRRCFELTDLEGRDIEEGLLRDLVKAGRAVARTLLAEIDLCSLAQIRRGLRRGKEAVRTGLREEESIEATLKALKEPPPRRQRVQTPAGDKATDLPPPPPVPQPATPAQDTQPDIQKDTERKANVLCLQLSRVRSQAEDFLHSWRAGRQLDVRLQRDVFRLASALHGPVSMLVQEFSAVDAQASEAGESGSASKRNGKTLIGLDT